MLREKLLDKMDYSFHVFLYLVHKSFTEYFTYMFIRETSL